MFKNRKLEIKLVKDTVNTDEFADATPSVTKEDILHIAKNVLRYTAGAALVVLAAAATIDTAKYAAMSGIENRYNQKELED